MAKVSGMKRKHNRRESGTTLLETLVALSILSVVAIAYMSGLSTSAGAIYTADERATAESLALSQMEWAKNSAYTYNGTSYSLAPVMDATDYQNYSANITAAPLHNPDEGIQKITVVVRRSGEVVYTLEGYKVDR
jgi:type II secretory pathway pseudopilin PulG